MYFRGIGTATPATRYTKAECLAAFEKSDWFARLDARAHCVARAVLQRDNGIEARRLAVDSLEEVFAIDPNTLAQRFLAHAPALAARAAASALAGSGLTAPDLGAVIVSTCTGYLCPGLSGHVVERLGPARRRARLRSGRPGLCGGAAESSARACLAGVERLRPCAVDLRRGEQRRDVPRQRPRRPDQCLSVWRRRRGGDSVAAKPAAGRRIEWIDSTSLIEPSQRQALMFEQPRRHAAQHPDARRTGAGGDVCAAGARHTVLGRAGLRATDVRAWILHAGGRDVLLALEREFGLEADDFRYSAAMLREYGNLSSAFVYFVLEAALADAAPAGWWWLSSFGAGFSCHGALLRVS
jgi:predicted naringenin-chalcone synthase